MGLYGIFLRVGGVCSTGDYLRGRGLCVFQDDFDRDVADQHAERFGAFFVRDGSLAVPEHII
jgi:hypothetical protein